MAKSIKKSKEKIIFSIIMNQSLANAIRRSVNEIPTPAIETVEIHKNDSALYDEIIAHRIGLIPIKTDKIVKESKFKLKEIGPKIVYSTEIQPSIGTDYELPIVILGEGQEIQMNLNANVGQGIEHIKYSPGLIYFKHNLDPSIIDFVEVDENGKVSYDEEGLKELPEEQVSKIKNAGDIKELMFNVESWGQIEVKEIFLRAIEALDKNLDELNKSVK